MTANSAHLPTDMDPEGDWIVRTVRPFSAFVVGSIVPADFAAYARLLHPAWSAGGTPVRWETVAAWSGRTMHPLVEFRALEVPARPPSGPRPFAVPPDDGRLPAATLRALCDHLRVHTASATCHVGIWEGYGWAEGAESTARLVLPERVHVVYTAGLDALCDAPWSMGDRQMTAEAFSVLWPVAARSWFVASDVDLDSTYVGGSAELIAAILRDPRLEALPVDADTSIAAGPDHING